MKASGSALALVALLAAVPASAARHILISDSLLANADEWEVKRGGHGAFHKWRFGDYAVVEGKSGWTHSGTNTNLFHTRMETHVRSTFSFVLGSKTPDSAFVDAAHGIVTRSQPGLKLGDVTVGGDDRVQETDVFTAAICINRDTSETWDLTIIKSDVSNQNDESIAGSHTAALTLGGRRIVITPVYSMKLDKKPSFGASLKLQFSPPAMGYEFVEDGQSVCAVEYFSKGFGGSFKNTIWMRRDADPRMQLVLAAAMTALLQVETAALEQMAREPAKP